MKQPDSMAELDDFAKQCLKAEIHPNDYHDFVLFSCHSCRGSVFRITIEHHTGSEAWDFKGIIWGECLSCGYLGRLFTFTGDHRRFLREEQPVCDCGNRSFLMGQCDRTEGEEGIPGFFDEGVVVGKCLLCKRNKAFVFTD